jgi:hypothetical protein
LSANVARYTEGIAELCGINVLTGRMTIGMAYPYSTLSSRLAH